MAGQPAPDPKYPAISTQWPTSEELAAAARIRDANKEAIARLKDPARDVVGDLRVVRFLRARHHKEAEATQWYGDFLKSRVDAHPEIESTIRPVVVGLTPEEFMAWWQERVHPSLVIYPWLGATPDGMGVFLGRPGMIDAVRFTEERGGAPLARDEGLLLGLLEWTLWHLDEESHRQQRMLYVVKVMDFKGLASEGRKLPMWVPKMKEFIMSIMLQTSQKSYCEHDAMFIILNAPFIFRALFAVFSVALTAKQKSKMTIMGSTSDAKVRARLLELVPASLLPKELGGDLECVEHAYPPRQASAIPEYIQRMATIEMWPPRQPGGAS